VLSNHDVTRPVTRYGRADTRFAFENKREGTPTDLARGTRRARAAALLAMALPGSMYIYQGEELGLPEAENIPADRRQDPMWHRSGGLDPGRDGCRVPIPWSGSKPPYGFSPNEEMRLWLDQPDNWAPLSVDAQTADPASTRTCAGSNTATTSSHSRAATVSSASSISARRWWNCPRRPRSSSRVLSSSPPRYRRTPRSGWSGPLTRHRRARGRREADKHDL
jgi:glycosidase